MGEANRRRATQVDYGYPAIFMLQVFSGYGEQLAIVYLPIKRKPKRLFTNKDALAMAGVVIGYFVNPTDHNWMCLQNAIATYCHPLSAELNTGAVKEIAASLPVDFWAWVRETQLDEQGDRVGGSVLESRDTARQLKCKVTFASRPGVAPEQEGVEMRQFQGAAFERQLMEASK